MIGNVVILWRIYAAYDYSKRHMDGQHASKSKQDARDTLAVVFRAFFSRHTIAYYIHLFFASERALGEKPSFKGMLGVRGGGVVVFFVVDGSVSYGLIRLSKK